MTEPLCQQCYRPSPHGYLCPACLSRLEQDLGQVGWLAHQLDLTLSRQTASGADAGVRARSADTPLPFAWGPADLAYAVRNTLGTWARDVADSNGLDLPAGDAPRRLAEWLCGQLSAIKRHPAAGELADEVGYAVEAMRRAVFRPPASRYLGPCDDCGRELYAPTGASEARCACSASYAIAERERYLLDVADDQLLPYGEISEALSGLVEHGIPVSTLRVWVHRGQLVQHGRDRNGRALLRVGEVADLVLAMKRRQQQELDNTLAC